MAFRWIQRTVILTATWPLLSQAYRILYLAQFYLAVYILRGISDVRYVFVRRPGALADLYPGDSDIDLSIVFYGNCQEFLRKSRRCRRVVSALKRCFPVLGEIRIQSSDVFLAHFPVSVADYETSGDLHCFKSNRRITNYFSTEAAGQWLRVWYVFFNQILSHLPDWNGYGFYRRAIKNCLKLKWLTTFRPEESGNPLVYPIATQKSNPFWTSSSSILIEVDEVQSILADRQLPFDDSEAINIEIRPPEEFSKSRWFLAVNQACDDFLGCVDPDSLSLSLGRFRLFNFSWVLVVNAKQPFQEVSVSNWRCIRELADRIGRLNFPISTDPITVMTTESHRVFKAHDPLGHGIYNSGYWCFSEQAFIKQSRFCVSPGVLRAELARVIGLIQSYSNLSGLTHDFLDLLIGQLAVTNRLLGGVNMSVSGDLLYDFHGKLLVDWPSFDAKQQALFDSYRCGDKASLVSVRTSDAFEIWNPILCHETGTAIGLLNNASRL